jgi:hypothetical protein
MESAQTLQDAPNTLVVSVHSATGQTKLSFFGGISISRINEPSPTADRTLLVASAEDLLATKLKAILDRAEAKADVNIAALLQAGVSLERSLAGFAQMFKGEPASVLRAIGYFEDGDLRDLNAADRELLTRSRDAVGPLPAMSVQPGLLTGIGTRG